MIPELRFAVRSLRRNPILCAAIVASLGVGVGGNTAAYAVLRAVNTRLLPVPSPQQIFRVEARDTVEGAGQPWVPRMSVPDFMDVARGSAAALPLAAFVRLNSAIGRTGPDLPVSIDAVSSRYFSVLGLKPVLGRLVGVEDTLARGATPIVDIGENLWRTIFGGDSSIVGTAVTLGGARVVVVGVVPAPFAGTTDGVPIQVWTPLQFYPDISGDAGVLGAEDATVAEVFGRVHSARDLSRLTAELSVAATDVANRAPTIRAGWQLRLVDGSRAITPEKQARLNHVLLLIWVLLACVYVIACANAASLLLARAIQREREIATRLALGVSRANLVKQLLIESVVLSTTAGLVGLGVAFALVRAAARLRDLAMLSVAMDGRVLSAAIVGAGCTGLLFGLMPAMSAAKTDLVSLLKGSRRGRHRWLSTGQGFVTLQMVCSVALLTGASLIAHAVFQATRTDPGYDVEHVAFVRVIPPRCSGQTAGENCYFVAYDRLSAALVGSPGVRGVSEGQQVPLRGVETMHLTVAVAARDGRGVAEHVAFDNVGPGYFHAMGIRMLEGRDFMPSDRSLPVDGMRVIVNRAFARSVWPRGAAVGRTLEVWGKRATVVGVAADTHHATLFDAEEPKVFVATVAQEFWLMVRFAPSVPADAIPGILRARLSPVMSGRPGILLGHDLRARILVMPEVIAGSLAGLAWIAVLIAAIGLYALVSLAMAQQSREIAIRIALGANRARVLRLAAGYASRPVLVGLILGLGAAFATVRLVGSLVFGAGAPSAWGIAVAVGTFVITVALATLVPAIRAWHVDPVRAMRDA